MASGPGPAEIRAGEGNNLPVRGSVGVFSPGFAVGHVFAWWEKQRPGTELAG